MLIKKIAYLALWSLLTFCSVIVTNSNLVSGNGHEQCSLVENQHVFTLSNEAPFSSHAIANKENDVINSFQNNQRKPSSLLFTTNHFLSESLLKYTSLNDHFFFKVSLVKTPIILQIRNLRI